MVLSGICTAPVLLAREGVRTTVVQRNKRDGINGTEGLGGIVNDTSFGSLEIYSSGDHALKKECDRLTTDMTSTKIKENVVSEHIEFGEPVHSQIHGLEERQLTQNGHEQQVKVCAKSFIAASSC